jgi:excisionase family DNA binding protein
MQPVATEREPITALEHERRALAEAEQLLEHFEGGERQTRPKLVGPGGEEVELSDALFHVLRQAVHHLSRGNSVAIAPLHRELTTQQAADLLNVSRPYLVQLLEEGHIPFTKTGTHRRVRLPQRRDGVQATTGCGAPRRHATLDRIEPEARPV